jgi:type IV secretory pathway VirB10-like protein
MRAKLVTFGITAVATLALVVQASSQAVAQGNANKPAAAKKKTPPPPPPKQAETKPAPPAPAAGQTMAAKPKPKPKKKAPAAMAGVPKGVPACIKHLTTMAAKDPLIAYDGHPSEIVNGGLLWNDPKSRCSVASDDAMKKKVLELADAWRRKDASQVRSILAELAK